jgi:AAA15 family ATPase/GTPase
MVKFSSVNIHNFRSIESLHIGDFKRANLITGRNNCGKTSVLEALFQVSGMSNSQLPIAIHNNRDLILTSNDDFKFIFHELDFAKVPFISAVVGDAGIERSLSIKPKYADPHGRIINIENKARINSNHTPQVSGLILEFSAGKDKTKFTSEVTLFANDMQARSEAVISKRYVEELLCSFHAPHLYMGILPQRLEKLIVNKQMSSIIETLREIDSRITAIHIGSMGTIYVDVGLKSMLPINIMGDGIRRILSIIAAVSDVQGGVLLVDEIENGLHYSTLKTLWKALFKALEVLDVQLFATTHSKECIDAFVSSHNEFYQDSDNCRLYRIERQKSIHKAFDYTPDMISVGVENDIEMR